MPPSKASLRRFEPVPVEDRPGPPEKASQSLLAQLDVCARAGLFYLQYGGGVQTHAMARGSCFHEFAEQATKHMLKHGEVELPVDVAVEMLESVIAEHHEWTFPYSDRKALISMATNWAKATRIDPSTVIAVERMAEVPVGDKRVRGKIDLLERVGDALNITDYKTSLSLPSQEKFARGFQGPFYGLLALLGKFEDTGEAIVPGGLAQINEVYFTEVYPRYYSDHTGLSSRTMSFLPEDLVEFSVAVEDLLGRLDEGLETGDFPATPGDHCARCPAPRKCPIPQDFRYIETATNDEEAAAVWDRATIMDMEVKRLKASARGYVEAAEQPVDLGNGTQLGFTKVESEVVQNKDALKAFVEQTPNADVDSFYTHRTSTRFGVGKRDEE